MEAIRSFFNQFNREQKFILAFCLVVILCSMCRDCMLCRYIPKLDGYQLRRFEGFEDAPMDPRQFKDGKPNLVYFSQTWCGYCKRFNDDWNTLAAKLTDATPIKIVGDDGGAMDKLMEREEVRGYPTIILYKKDGDKVVKIPFKGERSVDALLEFVKSSK